MKPKTYFYQALILGLIALFGAILLPLILGDILPSKFLHMTIVLLAFVSGALLRESHYL